MGSENMIGEKRIRGEELVTEMKLAARESHVHGLQALCAHHGVRIYSFTVVCTLRLGDESRRERQSDQASLEVQMLIVCGVCGGSDVLSSDCRTRSG